MSDLGPVPGRWNRASSAPDAPDASAMDTNTTNLEQLSHLTRFYSTVVLTCSAAGEEETRQILEHCKARRLVVVMAHPGVGATKSSRGRARPGLIRAILAESAT